MKRHYGTLPGMLQAFADERGLEFKQYSEYHMRIFYKPRVVLDVWTTGKYYVLETNYMHGIVERGGEKGQVPGKQTKLFDWLDQLFFAVEIKEAKYNAE